jgi:hypothetical protein
VTCEQASGSTFSYDPNPTQETDHTVICTAEDSSGNTATVDFGVTVVDVIAPEYDDPADTVIGTGEANLDGTSVTFDTPTATDAVGVTSNTCDPISGSLFNYTPNTSGTSDNTVTCTASDGSDNTTVQNYVVRISDTVPPNITVGGDNPVHWLFDANNLFTPGTNDEPVTVYDDAEGDITSNLVRTPSDTFSPPSVGIITITYTADDTAGNLATPQTRDVNTFTANFDGDLKAGQQSNLIIEDLQAFIDAPSDPPTITATLDSSISDPVTVTLTSDGTQRFSTIIQLTDIPADTVPFDGVECPTLYILNDLDNDPDNWICELETNVQFLDVDHDNGDNITLNYRGFTKEFVSGTFDGNPGVAFGGSATDPTDEIRFVESDAYYEQSTATLRVRNATAITEGVTAIPITLTAKDQSGTVLDTFDLTATPISGSSDLFETGGVTIVPSNAGGASNVIVSPAPSTISATYGDTTATANVIESATVTQLFDPDTTLVETCAAGDSDNGADTDSDGLCDFWEHPAANVALRIPTSTSGEYYELACDDAATLATDPTGATVCPTVGTPDLYIEYDYMIGHTPSSTAISDFVSAMDGGFVRNSGGAVVGVHAHVIVDDEIQHHDVIPYSDSTNTVPTFLTLKEEHFGTASERDTTACIDAGTSEADCIDEVERLLTAKRQVFRYGMSIHDQAVEGTLTTASTSSGYAERPGNDFIVSLGSYTAYQGSIGQQSGTLMHEVGHTLGLYHGGEDDINCKPNYPSVMNYLYQFTEADGGQLADRPLDYSRALYTTIDESSLTNGMKIIGSTTRTMVIGGIDTSDSTLNPFEEDAGTNDIRSRRGTIAGTAEPITWAPNTHNIRYFADVAGCQATDQFGLSSDSSFTGLRAQDDWGAIVFNFRNTNGFSSGSFNIVGSDDTNADNTSGTADGITSGVHRLYAGPDVTINETLMYEPEILVVDPHQSSWTLTIDYGDGTSFTKDGFSTSVVTTEIDHQYADDGVYQVAITIDNGFAPITDYLTVTVENYIPVFGDLGTVTGFEESPITHTGGSLSFATVDNPPISLTADFGDDTAPVSVELTIDGTSATFTLEHIYVNTDASTTITLTADDGDGELVTGTIIPTIQTVYDDVTFTDPLSNKPYQEGRTIPVKFTVVEDGISVTNLSPEILVQFGNDTPFSVGFATFDVNAQHYSLQLDTSGYPTSGTVNIIAKLPDYPIVGNDHSTTIKLKSGSK